MGLKVSETEVRQVRRAAVLTVRDAIELAKRCREIPRWSPERFEVITLDGQRLPLDTVIGHIVWTETTEGEVNSGAPKSVETLPTADDVARFVGEVREMIGSAATLDDLAEGERLFESFAKHEEERIRAAVAPHAEALRAEFERRRRDLGAQPEPERAP